MRSDPGKARQENRGDGGDGWKRCSGQGRPGWRAKKKPNRNKLTQHSN